MDRGIFDIAMYQTLKLGGNADSNCAAVGGIIGAMIGLRNLPRDKLRKIISCDTLKGKKGGQSPTNLPTLSTFEMVRQLISVGPPMG